MGGYGARIELGSFDIQLVDRYFMMFCNFLLEEMRTHTRSVTNLKNSGIYIEVYDGMRS